jgi:hypothetical protein
MGTVPVVFDHFAKSSPDRNYECGLVANVLTVLTVLNVLSVFNVFLGLGPDRSTCDTQLGQSPRTLARQDLVYRMKETIPITVTWGISNLVVMHFV